MVRVSADSLSELRKRRSAKWRTFPEDVLPLPVAEMDYPIAKPIRDVLIDMVKRSDTGYWELHLNSPKRLPTMQSAIGTGR